MNSARNEGHSAGATLGAAIDCDSFLFSELVDHLYLGMLVEAAKATP